MKLHTLHINLQTLFFPWLLSDVLSHTIDTVCVCVYVCVCVCMCVCVCVQSIACKLRKKTKKLCSIRYQDFLPSLRNVN